LQANERYKGMCIHVYDLPAQDQYMKELQPEDKPKFIVKKHKARV